MKKAPNPFILALLSGFISSVISFSAYAQVKADKFLGKWKVEWHMAPTAPELDIAEDKTRHMAGEIQFHKEGKVEIKAFGYPGCLFSSDTIQNELYWTISDSTIKLFAKDEQFSLEYAIKKVNKQAIELSLMGDISVVLKR